MYTRKHSIRFAAVFLALILCLLVYIIKLSLIQVFRSDHLAKLAERQHNNLITLEPRRGTIYDRNLRPYALNVTVFSLFANPRAMSADDKRRAIQELPALLNIDAELVRERLGRDKYFVWLERKIPMDTYKTVKGLGIPGLDFIKESKRFYPNQFLASHIIGFAGLDNAGLEGIELKFDKYLRGKEGASQILRDARQRELLIEKNYVPAQDGFDVVLTIDETLQYIAERALEKGFITHNAKSATIIVMDPWTGEILALANRPTYNLNNFRESSPESRTNRAVAHVYEPGSVFKIVTASAALEENAFTEADVIFCENGSYRIGNHNLKDHHPLGHLTFQQVFEKSSNIGTAKIAQKMGPETVYRYGRQFRFGIPTGIDLPGEVNGYLKSPRYWSKTTIGAIPMGHEVTVTPLQLAAAISAVANGGVYMRPHVVKYIKDSKNEIIRSFEPRAMDRVISEATAERIKKILQGAVETGTGTKAKMADYTSAGKTGTAQKVVDGLYSHNKYYGSFIGFAPVDNPRLAVVVVYDEPHPSYYGGTVAAPVFKEVVENSLKYLNSHDNQEALSYAPR